MLGICGAFTMSHRAHMRSVETIMGHIGGSFPGKKLVSVHVERKTEPALACAYYVKAIGFLEGLHHVHDFDSCVFLIFTDDRTWCQRYLGFPPHTVYVKEPEHIEIMLMSRAAAHLLANTAFSWWAAYLGDRESKKQIMVPQDYAPNESYPLNAYPMHWRTIANTFEV